MNCYLTFCESGYQGAGLQRLVDRLHPNFCCESEQCSPHSPGPVSDDETLAFILINNTHYDQIRGELAPAAFQELYKRDLSLLRVNHLDCVQLDSTVGELLERGARKIPPIFREVEYVSVVSASQIRSFEFEGQRQYGVYDTALAHKRAHASVFVRAAVLGTKSAQKKARSDMIKVFGSRVQSIDALRSALR